MKISVCIATYNGSLYLKEQLDSILCQLSPSDEIIISDDGSSDDTINIVKRYLAVDKRIVLLNGPKDGLIKNFFYALGKASGDIIFLSDQDDIWMPNKVESFLTEFISKDADLVLSDCTVIDKNKNVLADSFFCLNKSKKGLLKNLIKNSYLGCCMAFKRECLNDFLFDDVKIPMHDWWFGLVSECLNYKIVFINKPLMQYRRHGSNASPSGETSNRSLSTKLLDRFQLISSLFKLKLRTQ